MEVRSVKRNGMKTLRIVGIERGDGVFVVPLLILQGMTEKEATEGYKQAVEGQEFSCVTRKNVSVHCSR